MPSAATSFIDARSQISATILSGTATTAEIDLGGTTPVGIQLPATMTQTSMKISVATVSGGTFQTLIDSTTGSDITLTIASAKYVGINYATQALLIGARFIKLLTVGNEGADRALTLISRSVC